MEQIRFIDDYHFSQKRGEPDNTWEVFGNTLSEIFGEIVNDDELLEKCYCAERGRKFDDIFLRSIVTNLPGIIFYIPEINEDPSNIILKWMDEDNLKRNPSPLIILGDVGTGKSTWINHFFKIEINNLRLSDYFKGIIINLGSLDRNIDCIRDYIHKEIEQFLSNLAPEVNSFDLNGLIDFYKDELLVDMAIYNELKKRNKKIAEGEILQRMFSFNKDKFKRNIALFKYIKNKFPKLSIFIIFDNVDHHPKEIQAQIFFLCRDLLREYKCSIFMTARKYTVPKIFKHIDLSAFQTRFLALTLPDTMETISKRKDYILSNPKELNSLFSKINQDKITIICQGKQWIINLDDLKDRLDFILNSLLNKEITLMLEKLSGYDLRFIMRAIKVALSSGYLYPEDKKRDRITEHDFLRAIILGNNPLYVPSDSLILNLLCDENKGKNRNNLIRLRILQTIDILGNEALLESIIDFLKSLGYDEIWVKKVINYMLRVGLIESPLDEGFDIIEDNITTLSLSISGRYYINELITTPRYLQHLPTSSYINESHAELVKSFLEDKKNVTPKERIKNIYYATEAFLDFIEKKEDQEREEVLRSDDPNGVINMKKIPLFKKYINGFKENVNKILSSMT